MNRVLLYGSRLVDSCEYLPFETDYVSCETKSSNDSLLDYIFGCDPVTGKPIGDLSVYLGDKANPEIRAFIESSLLQPISSDKSNLDLPDEVRNKFRSLSDDDFAFFSRNHDESSEEYANRLRLYFAEEKLKRIKESKAKDDAEYMRQWREKLSS